MIFLVIYDTKTAKLLDIKEYDVASRSQAMEDFRTEQEKLLPDLDRIEVSLFEAASRSALERTHSRYFKTLAELGASLSDTAKKTA
jgi:hypothetical protein